MMRTVRPTWTSKGHIDFDAFREVTERVVVVLDARRLRSCLVVHS